MARDIIVIGASAGGVEALKALFRDFNPSSAVSVFIVLHFPARGVSRLPDILAMQTRLSVHHAVNGGTIQPGCVYVAPPDHHLIIELGHMHLTRGPKENRARPAINPLFRSAALAYGPRVIGVILSGMLDDGTAGLWEIKRRGGIAVVQSLEDAQHEQMPESAVASVDVDYQIPVAEMGVLLLNLIAGSPTQSPAKLESIMSENTRFTCPDCHGPIERLRLGDLKEYRCRVGHAYSEQSMLEAHEDAEERTLWSAVETLEEGAELVAEVEGEKSTNNGSKVRASVKRKLAQTIRDAIEATKSNKIHVSGL